MNAQQIRQAYLDFCKKNGHEVIPRALLIPQGESGVLFIGSGMQPLIPYLLGEAHPQGTRLADSQTCLRAQDMDEVGDNRHTTFFEMLGNWSLGDYFKQEQLPWFFKFLVDIVGLDPSKIYVTTFIGDEEYKIPKDTESTELWQKIFKKQGVEAKVAEIGSDQDGYERGIMPGERIFYYDADTNWWAPEGAPGNMSVGQPGGPDSEVFYLFDQVEHDPKWGKNCHPNCDCGRFMEIGNSVFMEFVRTDNGFAKLPKQNVDFGGGLERIAAAKLDSPDVFKISVLLPIVQKLEQISKKSYKDHTEEMRVIVDHLRGAMFLAVDGVRPSNKEHGYVMRRLMRRAILRAFSLGIEQNFLPEVAPVIAQLYRDDFPELLENEEQVVEALVKEEKAFKQTLRKGLREFEKILRDGDTTGLAENSQLYDNARKSEVEYKKIVTGDVLFRLYDTFGFPLELAVEEAQRRGIATPEQSMARFNELLEEQRTRSRTAAKGAFKGGLGGQTLQHKKYHTATHLMYQALRDVLGGHVVQHGSNITEERLRFDFSHPEKVTQDQIKQVEQIVNQQITNDLQVTWAEYATEEATGPLGALGQFGDRYGDTVKVYSMKDPGAAKSDRAFSFEICGGPHVENTMMLAENGERFKIVKEQSSSAGIRRIKAILE